MGCIPPPTQAYIKYIYQYSNIQLDLEHKSGDLNQHLDGSLWETWGYNFKF